MCIISGPVKTVSNTQIFVGCNKDRSRQITVYGNEVDNISHSNAMILPVPFPKTVELINLSNYKDIFSDCMQDFSTPRSAFQNYESDGLRANSSRSLQVHNVGSYAMSIAHNLADLDRVNSNVFTLHPDCKSVLTKHYSDPHWGFIICQLKGGKQKYHPIAYSHATLNGKYFIPTLHHHAHGSHGPSGYFGQAVGALVDAFDAFDAFNGASGADWDHTIYIQNGEDVDQVVAAGRNPSWIATPSSQWKGTFSIKDKLSFVLSKTRSFNRVDINGEYKNQDLYITLRPRGSKPSAVASAVVSPVWAEAIPRDGYRCQGVCILINDGGVQYSNCGYCQRKYGGKQMTEVNWSRF